MAGVIALYVASPTPSKARKTKNQVKSVMKVDANVPKLQIMTPMVKIILERIQQSVHISQIEIER